MSFGGSSLSVFNPPPPPTPASPTISGPPPQAPPAFGGTQSGAGSSAPVGSRPIANQTQPTVLGAALTPIQGGNQTSAPTLMGQGAQVSPSAVPNAARKFGR